MGSCSIDRPCLMTEYQNSWSSFTIFFFFLILDKFILKTWISSRVSYFVRISNRVEDIFFSVVHFFLLNLKFIGISKPHKNSIQKEKLSNR